MSEPPLRRAVFALVSTLVATPGFAGDLVCSSPGGTPVAVATVDARLELQLSDGRRLRLVGLDPAAGTPADPGLDETGRSTLSKAIEGKRLSARIISDHPDRWGRLSAMVHVDGDTAGDLARLAIARGLGRYLAEPAAHGCRDGLLAAESEARTSALGLWHDPYYGVLAVDDRAAFAERSATIVVTEGRLRRVDPGAFRTKLRFAAPGADRQGALIAVVLPKVVKRFEEQGVHFEALIGQRMRLRGLLDLRFGPQVEIAGPDALEILPEPRVATP